jgi:hypothetical protein
VGSWRNANPQVRGRLDEEPHLVCTHRLASLHTPCRRTSASRAWESIYAHPVPAPPLALSTPGNVPAGDGLRLDIGWDRLEAARADGGWESALTGPATINVPDDLAEALAARSTECAGSTDLTVPLAPKAASSQMPVVGGHPLSGRDHPRRRLTHSRRRDCETFFDTDLPALLAWHFDAADAAGITQPPAHRRQPERSTVGGGPGARPGVVAPRRGRGHRRSRPQPGGDTSC